MAWWLQTVAVVLVIAVMNLAQAAETRFLGLRGQVPETWQEQQPANSMRRAQYRIPGESGAATLVVYYFGPGQGGSVEANIARWRSQFSGPDGGEVEPEVQRLQTLGLPVTVASFTGDYARGIGTGPKGEAVADQTLLAAILETPRAPVIFQLYGPSDTVSGERPAFLRLLRGLQPVDHGN